MPRHERFADSDESSPKTKSPSKNDKTASSHGGKTCRSSALLANIPTPLSVVHPTTNSLKRGGATHKITSIPINSTEFKCVVCAQNGPFSVRQLKRAAIREPARCVKCIERNLAIPGKDAAPQNKETTEAVKENQKQRMSNGKLSSDSSSSSSSSSSSTSSSSSDSSDSSSSSSDSSDSDSSNVKKSAKTNETEAAEDAEEKPRCLSKVNDSSVPKPGSLSVEEEAEYAWSDPEEEDDMDISLNAIKRKVLGRDIQTDHHESPNAVDNTTPEDTNLEGRTKMMPLQGSSSLKSELSCAICYEVLYQPISLNCGHSFCHECLNWWLAHSQRSSQPPQEAAASHEKCPTCRRGLTCDGASLGVNMALRACVAALFGAELQGRIQAEAAAKKKATAGENGGSHSRGYALLTTLEESDWTTLRCDGGARLSARRSIVLDEEDQRMQLALSLRREPNVSSEGLVQVELCLLTMEEDEAGDGGGFPIVLKEEEDDEHLICLEERLFSCIEAKAKIGGNFGAKPTFVPIARRGGLGQQEEEGVVQFKIDVGGTPALAKTVAFCFRHEETGAELEIKLPACVRRTDIDGATLTENDSTRRARRAEEIKDENENDEVEYFHSKGHVTNLDEFEDDGFVVMEADEEEDYENDDESEAGTHDEEDVCCLCQDGGYLIVCDGGDNLEGCARNFHIRCINRNTVPPGDWVCQTCANSLEFNVGIEGHEFAIEGEGDGGDVAVGEEDEDEDEDEDDTVGPPKGRLKRKRNNTLENDKDDSDGEEFEAISSCRPEATQNNCGDESDGSLVVLPQQKSKASKKLFMWDSDDE